MCIRCQTAPGQTRPVLHAASGVNDLPAPAPAGQIGNAPGTGTTGEGAAVSFQLANTVMQQDNFSVTTPEGRLTAYAKLRASLDGSTVVWWYRGIQYGVVDLAPKRLWAVQGLQVTSFKRREDGSFDNLFRDLMLYQDLATGETLKDFRNPYTNEAVAPSAQVMGPMNLIYSRAGAAIKDLENVPPGMETDWRVDRAVISGDDLILHEEAYSRVTDGALQFVVNDFITLQGRLSDAVDPGIVNAPARYTYCTLASWPPFMQMGGRDGHLLGRGNARKVGARSELDPELLEQLFAVAPDWLEGISFPND